METSRQSLWSKNFAVFFLSSFCMSIGFQFLSPMLPLYATNVLGAPQSQIGYLIGGYSLAALVIRPYAGYAFDFMGRKKMYVIAMGMLAVISFFYPLSSTFFLLVLVRSLHGVCFGLTSTGSGAIVADILPFERRSEGIGYFGLAQTISSALGPALALSIMGDNQYKKLFLIASVLIVFAFAFSSMIALPKQVKPTRAINLKSLLEKRVYRVSALNMLVGVVNGTVMSYILIYSKEIGIVNGGVYFLGNSIGVAVTRLFTGKLVDKHGPKYVVTFGFISFIAGIIVLSMSTGLISYIIAAVLMGLGNGIIMPCLQAMTINIVEPENRGVASTTYYALTDIGVGGGAIILGMMTKYVSLRDMFLYNGLFLLIPLILFHIYVMNDYNRKLALITAQN
ncbi:bacillibactin exporter [Oxobacter pfennigii]|uniref:Bacillibactin exporter n=1 Tax=Oxobacter pfennigii TaxID=36849 RepID=A0A0P8YD82_9CLOT|nr:MFS transporter [Oxobacter pfennigii]KPU45199.1 bacillibactin exporter [Oxobacter pfennigii]